MAMKPRRPRRPLQCQNLENAPPFAQYSQNQRLQAQRHSEAENAEARRRAAQLINGGHGSVEWDNSQLCLLWEQK